MKSKLTNIANLALDILCDSGIRLAVWSFTIACQIALLIVAGN